MTSARAIARPVRIAGLAAALAFASAAFAQTPAAAPAPASASAPAQDKVSVDTLRDQFPAASIDSVLKADDALRATSAAKPRVDSDFKTAAQACLGTVLVNRCLDEARTKRRNRMNDINAVEIEANRFKRSDRATRLDAERASREAERTAKAPADQATRQNNRKAYEARQSDAARSASERSSRNGASKPSGKVQPRKPVPPADAEIHAAQRAKNATDYTKKRKDAETHQADIQRRLVEKAADDKRRAAAKAAKDAKDARAAAAAAKAAESGFPSMSGPKP